MEEIPMAKAPFDQNAVIEMFETATVKGSRELRQAVGQATLQALKGREMTLSNLKGVVKAMADAASLGVARNHQPGVDPQDLLDKAVSGMDDALIKAVEAHRTALSQLSAQGADLREKHLKKALGDLEKMEDTFFGALTKAAQGADTTLGGAWAQVLDKVKAGDLLQSGPLAATTAEQLVAQMQSSMRETRSASLRAAQALAEGYAAMVSGVLLGMSEALKQGASVAESPAAAPASPAAAKTRRKKA
jgi:hypothetical protein